MSGKRTIHIEHHVPMWVNSYKLPLLRLKLEDKVAVDRMEVEPGYIAVLREASGEDRRPD